MLRRFWRDDSGMETVEYAIMAALIVLAAITAIRTIGENVVTKFEELNTNMQ